MILTLVVPALVIKIQLTDSAYGTELVKQVLVADGVRKSLQSNTINGTFSCNIFDCQSRSLNLLQAHRKCSLGRLVPLKL